LLEDDTRRTEHYDRQEVSQVAEVIDKARPSLPVHPDAQPVNLRLKIGSLKREVEIPLNKPIFLGRVDPSLDVFPEIDLTHDGPQAKSVSRRHAVIVRQQDKIMVEDLGSVNGTFINGKRLDPYLPEILYNGDVLQLGKMLIEVEIRIV
jgi:pSer/pThr/pTyr-binding forkhead associated (FHA) protein